MLVKELIEELDTIDRECEIVIVLEGGFVTSIRKVVLDPYYEKYAEIKGCPLCIKCDY